MNEECLFSIFPVHSAAVIGHADKRDSAACKFNCNPCSTAVYCVVDKFFNDRYGPFYDFAGLDGIGGLSIKNINPAQCLPPGTSASVHRVCSWLQ